MKNTKFRFFENNYDYESLKKFDVIKTFTESSHFDRKVVKDTVNDLMFLYEFYEWVDFSEGNDEIFETYTLVSNEIDAEELNNSDNIRRRPYFRVNPDYKVYVQMEDKTTIYE